MILAALLQHPHRTGVVAVLFLLCSMVLAAPPAEKSPAEIERRVDALLAGMTLEQKIDLIGGVDRFYIRAIPALDIPKLKMADGPAGVRNYGPATAVAGGIGLAASWDFALAEKVGIEIGRDARARGVHFMLGPGVNIYVSPLAGRNFEYFGEDPFLASRIATAYIKGVQAQGVSATVKHFLGNNSEFDRHNVDAIIDERTLREIYLPVFEAAVKDAHVGAIMDSYNLVNGEHLTQSSYFNNEIVKQEWGFKGIIMSDWDATYDGVAAANGGLDLEMPAGTFMNRGTLLPAIKDGKVSQATIDDKVRRILRTAVRFGWLDREQTDLSIPLYNQQGRLTALQTAREGTVLLKNDRQVLPLSKSKTRTILLVGPDSHPTPVTAGGSGHVEPFAPVSLLQGLNNVAGPATTVLYQRGIPSETERVEATEFFTTADGGERGLKVEIFDNPQFAGQPIATRIDRHVNLLRRDLGSVAGRRGYSIRWSGYYVPQVSGDYEFDLHGPGDRGGFRLFVDGQLVIDNWDMAKATLSQAVLPLGAGPHKILLEQYRDSWFFGLNMGIVRRGTLVDPAVKKLAATADAVIIAAGFDAESEGEASDRTFSLPFGQDELIREVAEVNKNTVVVMTAGGNVDMSQWIDRVPAILQAWYPGQEGGTALAEILMGEVNPSGHLPVTFERRWQDNPSYDSYYPQPGTRRVPYKNGIFVGYRGYEHRGVSPLFAFGHGLSYTTFRYENLAVTPLSAAAGSSGGKYEITFDIQNTGERAGAAVAQVYVGQKQASVPRPPKELKGFARVDLRPGERKHVTLTLDDRALAFYDVQAKRWTVEPGVFEILVGNASDDIALRREITVARESSTYAPRGNGTAAKEAAAGK